MTPTLIHLFAASTEVLRFSRFRSHLAASGILVGFLFVLLTASCAGKVPAEDNSRDANVPTSENSGASNPLGQRVQNAAIIAQALVTIIAMGFGGAYAWRKGYIFRQGQPYVTISHDITHRSVSDGYIHLEITATLHNTSLVKVEFRNALFTVQQLAPASDEYVFHLDEGTGHQTPGIYRPLNWEYLLEILRVWNEDELVVEPGMSAAVTFEHVLSRTIQSVSVTTHFYNVKVMGAIPAEKNPRDEKNRKRLGIWEVSGTKGWNRTTT